MTDRLVPDPFEPGGRHLGISDSVSDRSMAQISLEASGIHPPVSQGIPTGVSEHVRVHWEG